VSVPSTFGQIRSAKTEGPGTDDPGPPFDTRGTSARAHTSPQPIASSLTGFTVFASPLGWPLVPYLSTQALVRADDVGRLSDRLGALCYFVDRAWHEIPLRSRY
jgi:hypothetical protein